MWLSERKKGKESENLSGQVTISGEKCAVLGFSERRNICVYAPGGYFWRPARGDEVLVLKEGGIVGKTCADMKLEPGEVCISSAGGAEIRLKNDGNIYIKGKIIEEE